MEARVALEMQILSPRPDYSPLGLVAAAAGRRLRATAEQAAQVGFRLPAAAAAAQPGRDQRQAQAARELPGWQLLRPIFKK